MEAVSYYAIQASEPNSAQERGAYQTFDGSLWSQGVLPIDSIEILVKQRGEDYLQVDYSSTFIGRACAPWPRKACVTPT